MNWGKLVRILNIVSWSAVSGMAACVAGLKLLPYFFVEFATITAFAAMIGLLFSSSVATFLCYRGDL